MPIARLLPLLLWLAGAPCVLAEYRCMFDKIAPKVSELQTAVVRELPRTTAGGWQAYTAATPDWAPIRIKVFAEDLKNELRYCTQQGDVRPDFTGDLIRCQWPDVVTKEKMNIILTELLPKAVLLHAERLLVRPVRGALTLPLFKLGVCREFTVPAAHHVSGVAGADMLLYVAAAPTQDRAVAWASTCVTLRDGRPAAGVLNLSPSFVAPTRTSVRVVSHEIAHALGFHSQLMQRLGMITRHLGLRGKASTFVVSSNETRARAREHYGCNTAPGVELEDEGGMGTAYSHWERRNAKDELMNPAVGAGFYTVLTLAAFADMGYYRANFSMAEPMGWGYKAGCSLLQEKCLKNGVTAHPEMFCSGPSHTLACTSDRRALGTCLLVVYKNALAHEYRYFTQSNIGGHHDLLMDLCPVIVPLKDADCADGNSALMPGSRIGPHSLCLKGDSLQLARRGRIGDVCAEVMCLGGVVRVRYLGDDAWHLCPEGAALTPAWPFTGGRILCPRSVDVCPRLPDPPPGEGGRAETRRGAGTPGEKGQQGGKGTANTTATANNGQGVLEQLCLMLGIDCSDVKWWDPSFLLSFWRDA
ncbi:putative surface protease GP63, putative,metallopeptidase [Trypanosoma conorhini]|uniref:Leishmanolysin-like peptidase n=1 Tax=Trypanosoma conorhini TaxID=83891 RepID=A0A422PWN9_9TRYP|nr:putative surface protease GP63, putative,metallopeptidase [Trypanosoma conorhini]RNF22133.1 putative surface protease GP63, putative,metallopeptidase [Trypanosoma conorhini]